jgi:hypothetical protein
MTRRSAVPESIKNLLERRADQIASSAERCAASRESVALSAKIVVVSRRTIADSRAQIVRVGQPVGGWHLSLPHVRDR